MLLSNQEKQTCTVLNAQYMHWLVEQLKHQPVIRQFSKLFFFFCSSPSHSDKTTLSFLTEGEQSSPPKHALLPISGCGSHKSSSGED